MPNPFAGIPVGDYVRDAVALVLLLLSLALPWNLDGSMGTRAATGHIEVVLITLLSVLSLVLTYLARAQAFGPGFSTAQAALVRGAANLPYALLVAVYLVIDASKGSDEWHFSGGIGVAAAFGLSGAILAGMPRQSEADALAGWQVSVMRRGAVGLAAVWTALSFLNLILSIVSYRDYKGADLAMVAISGLIPLAALAAATLGLFWRSASARLALYAGALAVLGTTVIDWLTGWDLSWNGVESFYRPGLAVLPLLVLGAMVASPLVRTGVKDTAASDRDRSAATWLMLAMAGIAGASIIWTILALVGDHYSSTAAAIGYIVTLILVAAAVLVAATFVRQGFTGASMIAMGAVGATIVIGIVSLVLVDKFSRIQTLDILVHVGLPLAVITLLALSLRGAPVAATASTPPAPQATPAPPSPAVPPAPKKAPARKKASAPTAPAHPRADEAANPATSAQALHEIATTIPELRPAVAANPAAYADLVNWMAQLGEPAVDAAIAARAKG
jgi:hypothetical protein